MIRQLIPAFALVACAAVPVTAPAPSSLPPIPATVSSALGPVPIVPMDTIRNEKGHILLGGFVPTERTIYLLKGITSRAEQWQVIEHERCHIALFDAGYRLNSPDIDAFCDAIASARVNAMLSGAR